MKFMAEFTAMEKAVIVLIGVLLIVTLIIGFGPSANRAQASAWGKEHSVSLYSGGHLIGHWETTGLVKNEGSSDGYYFQDKETGKLIRISGEVIIEAK
jgi:hypothetical protein